MRDLTGGAGIAFFVGAFVCIVGLNLAADRGREQLATTLLFGLGLLLGLAVGPVINAYANADPAALWQAAGATGAFVATLGAVRYAIRRDLSSWARALFWALIALFVFGIVAIFVSIPNENLIYAIAGLVIFGGFTIFDFNRLQRAASRARSRSRPASSSTSSTCSCSYWNCSAATSGSLAWLRPPAAGRGWAARQPAAGGTGSPAWRTRCASAIRRCAD